MQNDLIIFLYNKLIKGGFLPVNFRFHADIHLLEEFNDACKTSCSLEDLEEAIKKSISERIIENTCLGSQMMNLALSEQGCVYVKQEISKRSLSQNRSTLKKVSDWLQDRSGLMSLLALVIAVIALFKN
jgi:hypothetical protein